MSTITITKSKNKGFNSAEFNELVYQNSKYLRVPALRFTQNQNDARDLVQETILKAINNKNTFKKGTNIKNWLYIIMKNTFVRDFHRINKKHSHLTSTDTVQDYEIKKQPINLGIEGIHTEEINNAISSLPEVYKVPFTLFLEGFKYEEISKKTGMPINTVKTRIHFARKQLMEQLKEYAN